jgi:hypothetical protein
MGLSRRCRLRRRGEEGENGGGGADRASGMQVREKRRGRREG